MRRVHQQPAQRPQQKQLAPRRIRRLGGPAQDVALDALRGVHGLRNPAAFDGWVRKIAVRRTMRALKQRRQRPGELPVFDDELWLEVAAPVVDRDLLIAARGALASAMAALPERQRVALVLRYAHDLTDREIADALGCRRGTANAELSRFVESVIYP